MDWVLIACKAVTSVLLVVGSIQDVRTKRVAGWITWSLVGLGLLVRSLDGSWILMIFMATLVAVDLIPVTWRVMVLGITAMAGAFWNSVVGDPITQFVVLWWVVAYVMWRLHVIGGADARIFMALIALVPNRAMVMTLAGGLIVVSLVWLLVLHRKRTFALLAAAARNMRALKFPSKEELAEMGRPTTPALALGGLVYMWGAAWFLSGG